MGIQILNDTTRGKDVEDRNSFPRKVRPFLLGRTIRNVIHSIYGLTSFIKHTRPIGRVSREGTKFRYDNIKGDNRIHDFLDKKTTRRNPSTKTNTRRITIITGGKGNLMDRKPNNCIRRNKDRFPYSFRRIQSRRRRPLKYNRHDYGHSNLRNTIGNTYHTTFALRFRCKKGNTPRILPISDNPTFD